jgi:hypothetical protein
MRSPFRTGRHSAAAPKSTIRSLLATAGIFAVAIGMAGTVTGSTYALWNNEVALKGAAVSTGTIGLTVDTKTELALTGMDLWQLLPGGSVVNAQPLTLRNTGSTRLKVSVLSTTFSAAPAAASTLTPAVLASYVQVSLRAANGTSCTVTDSKAALPASIAPTTLAVGGSTTVCLEVRLKADAPAAFEGQPINLMVNLTGVQMRPNES